jgi:hypothetical protein
MRFRPSAPGHDGRSRQWLGAVPDREWPVHVGTGRDVGPIQTTRRPGQNVFAVSNGTGIHVPPLVTKDEDLNLCGIVGAMVRCHKAEEPTKHQVEE